MHEPTGNSRPVRVNRRLVLSGLSAFSVATAFSARARSGPPTVGPGGSVTRYGAVCHTQVRYLTGELGLPADRITVVPNAVANFTTALNTLLAADPNVRIVVATTYDEALLPYVRKRLEAGQLILAGSFTRPVWVHEGDTFHADYGPLGSIAVQFATTK